MPKMYVEKVCDVWSVTARPLRAAIHLRAVLRAARQALRARHAKDLARAALVRAQQKKRRAG
ncbi:hypothetical protein [Paraburkholderia nodosa]|uniref:hypothetical protein n=1 Tax=Paraburkholderia nodosa TaxID=392320 RepID=UPI00048832CB|nr:hypothetical protein [Paraburkholderia nodosa]